MDGIYIGPADLSLAIGQKPSFDKPEGDPVYKEIMRILDHAKKNNIIAGIQNGQPERGTNDKKGFQLVTIGSDQRYMTAASKTALSKLKKIKQRVRKRLLDLSMSYFVYMLNQRDLNL